MKKTVMYTEARTWFFELDLAQGADFADFDETMRALKDTNGFYSYVDDCTFRMNTRVLGMRCRRNGAGRPIPTIPRTSEL